MTMNKPTSSRTERCAICGGALDDDEPTFLSHPDPDYDIFRIPSPAEFKAKLVALRSRPASPDDDDIPF
jgi:hypothetical protein